MWLWANQSSVADGCVCVPATYEPGPTVGRGRERPHHRHCVSLQLLSSDTRLIVHLNTTALSAARQPAGSPCRPARPLSAFIISPAGLPEPARSSDSRRKSDKVCTALQMPFPKYYKTSDSSCFACSFHPPYLPVVRDH